VFFSYALLERNSEHIIILSCGVRRSAIHLFLSSGKLLCFHGERIANSPRIFVLQPLSIPPLSGLKKVFVRSWGDAPC